MRTKDLGWLLALGLVAMPIAAEAGSWQLSLQGGTSIPTGDFGDEDEANAQSGWQVGGSLDYVTGDLFAFGFDGSMSGNSHASEGETVDLGGGQTLTLDEDNFSTWQFGAHAKVLIPSGSPLKPYALIGVGVSSTKEEWTETFTVGSSSTTSSGETTTDTRFGGRAGAGVLWWVNDRWGLGAEADYNYVNENEAETGLSSLTYVGLRGGLTIRLSGLASE